MSASVDTCSVEFLTFKPLSGSKILMDMCLSNGRDATHTNQIPFILLFLKCSLTLRYLICLVFLSPLSLLVLHLQQEA